MNNYEGVICVLKPPGMTSSDAVTDIRRVFNEKRVGHTGTLDPAAAGVLPICLGRATRLFDFLVDKQKEYIAELVLGAATDTEDATGNIIAVSDRAVTADEVRDALRGFTGEIMQTPPIYSALNVNGEKLYKLARRGEVTEALDNKKRSITVYETELLRETARNRFLIRIVCSKGTYIRTLCKDIGAALGCPAYMGFLLRTRSGSFTLENAYSIAELAELRDEGRLREAVIPMDEAIPHIPALDVSALPKKKKDLLIHGAAVKFEHDGGDVSRIYADGEFLGLGSVKNGQLRITHWLGPETHQVKGVKLEGKVVENNHIGRTIGFPTANLERMNVKLLPPEGVYATSAELEGKVYPAITSIGFNPTVGGSELTVETNIIGFEGDCYGKTLTVRFIERLRGMVKFPSLDELKAQLMRDREASLAIFSKYSREEREKNRRNGHN